MAMSRRWCMQWDPRQAGLYCACYAADELPQLTGVGVYEQRDCLQWDSVEASRERQPANEEEERGRWRQKEKQPANE